MLGQQTLAKDNTAMNNIHHRKCDLVIRLQKHTSTMSHVRYLHQKWTNSQLGRQNQGMRSVSRNTTHLCASCRHGDTSGSGSTCTGCESPSQSHTPCHVYTGTQSCPRHNAGRMSVRQTLVQTVAERMVIRQTLQTLVQTVSVSVFVVSV